MKAIQVFQSGGPEALTLFELPNPIPRPDEAVVAIKAAGVNFIDVYYREGRYPSPLPFTAGQEGAGIITTIGSEVNDLKIGDHVAFTGVRGSYAEYAAIPADRLVRIPGDLDFNHAAAAMLQGMTAHYLSHSTYAIKPGDTVLIHAAAGGVGLLLVQMAKHLGACVIGTVGAQEKAQLAREAGADEVILYTSEDFETETKRLTNGKGVDVVYDGVGKTTFEKDLSVLRLRGHLVLYGGSSGAVPPVDPMILNKKGSLYLTRPSLHHYIHTRDELVTRSQEVLKMIISGELNVRVHKIYPLADAALAHRDLEGRKTTGKLLLMT